MFFLSIARAAFFSAPVANVTIGELRRARGRAPKQNYNGRFIRPYRKF
jgi:hypothetical protein